MSNSGLCTTHSTPTLSNFPTQIESRIDRDGPDIHTHQVKPCGSSKLHATGPVFTIHSRQWSTWIRTHPIQLPHTGKRPEREVSFISCPPMAFRIGVSWSSRWIRRAPAGPACAGQRREASPGKRLDMGARGVVGHQQGRSEKLTGQRIGYIVISYIYIYYIVVYSFLYCSLWLVVVTPTVGVVLGFSLFSGVVGSTF